MHNLLYNSLFKQKKSLLDARGSCGAPYVSMLPSTGGYRLSLQAHTRRINSTFHCRAPSYFTIGVGQNVNT